MAILSSPGSRTKRRSLAPAERIDIMSHKIPWILACAAIAGNVWLGWLLLDGAPGRSSEAPEQAAAPPASNSASQDQLEQLRRDHAALQDQLIALELERSELAEQLGKVRNREAAPEPVDERGEPDPDGEDAPDAAELLGSLERFRRDTTFVGLDDLTPKERAILAPWADRMTMVRGLDGQIGLFGIHGANGKLSNISPDLEEWVDGLAAVSSEYRVQENLVIDDLIRRGRTESFRSKADASTYEAEERQSYRDRYGREHPGWSYRQDGDQLVLIDRELLESDPRLDELVALRAEVRTQLETRTGVAVDPLEKWMPGIPESAEDSEQGSN